MKTRQINWYYILIGVLFLTMLTISALFFKGSVVASIGIAQTKAYKINSEKSALVKSVPVVPGMQVKEGQLLVELTSQDLEIEIAKLENRIAVLQSERDEKSKLMEAKISYIKAQNSIVMEELDAEILKTSSELEMNENLTREFVSAEKKTSENPLAIKINSLNQQKQKHFLAMDIRIKDIEQENRTALHLLENQIVLLESELKQMKDEKVKLNKYATASGVVKNVNVKVGEQVDAFTSLLEVNPLHPTTVIAYHIGNKKEKLAIGSSVIVSTYDKHIVNGKVIGYGSVSELPEILQKSTAVKAFGQEIFIEVPADNQLFNGEKVLIR